MRVSVPLVALLPLHCPEAVQPVALTELQLNTVLPPETTLLGLAARVTLGVDVLVPRGIRAYVGVSR